VQQIKLLKWLKKKI